MRIRRVTFSKTGMGKYISHLDLLRCFTRAILRSGLPVVYSPGFNPHLKMTFALPLPIGVTSECETVDIQFEDSAADDEIMEKLNCNLPMDIMVLSVGEPVHKAADIVAAEYRMEAAAQDMVSEKKIQAFFGQAEVLVSKRTKIKGEKQINLLDFVRSWEITGLAVQGLCLRVILDAGGERNLKPDSLAQALTAYVKPLCIEDWDIHRVRIYCSNGEGTREIFG